MLCVVGAGESFVYIEKTLFRGGIPKHYRTCSLEQVHLIHDVSTVALNVPLGGAVKRERGKRKLKISTPRLTTFIAWRRPSKGDYCDLLNVMLIHYCVKSIYYMHVNRV